jgi:hypothetical protein
MTSNVSVEITAKVADLTAKRAIASAELKTFQKDLNELAETARVWGATDGLKKQMLASAVAVGEARSKLAGINSELKQFVPAAAGAHAGSAGVTRELIVMAREAGRGNFSRLIGSATILAGRLNILTPQVLIAGAAIAALALPFVAVAAAMNAHAEDLAKFQNAMQVTGGYAGLTAGQYEDMAARVARASNIGVGTARAALLALASSGRFTGAEMEQLANDSVKFGELTGRSSKEVLADFTKMADGPTAYAQEIDKTYPAFTLAQLEHIKNLEDEGKKSEATAEAVKDLTGWLNTQTVQMGPWTTAWHNVGAAIGDAWNAFEKFVSNDPGSIDTQVAHLTAQIKQMQSLSAQDQQHYGQTGRGGGGQAMYDKVLASLEQQRAALVAKGQAEQKAASDTAAATALQKDAIEAYDKSQKTFLSLKSSAAQAREAVKALNDEMALRLKANPNDAEAKDYFANKPRYDQALAKKLDPGDNKPAKADKDQVQEYQQQLQSRLESEKNYFADSKAEELAFWQAKRAISTNSAEANRQIDTKIYDLQKELAHQAYDAQIADYNDQLEAAKGDWAKTQALEAEKLAYIAKTQGDKSAAYKEAHKADEEAEREHQRQMAEIARTGEAEQLEELKANLATDKAIREANARTQETQIADKGKSTPGGEITAAVQIAALHKQLAAQEMADDAAVYAQEAALREKSIADELAANGRESTSYAAAVAAKKKLDDDYYNHKRQLENQAVQQQIADFQRIQQSWHGYVDPMVSTTGSQIKGLISGTESWNQAIMNIGEEALNLVIQAIEKMVAQWIVAQITGSAQQQITAKSQVVSYAGLAGAGGIASMAAAPFPLNLTAPEFGAAMEADALAFGAFAKGIDVVPDDMVAQIHRGERIMPAADNSQLMTALGAMGPGGRGAGLDGSLDGGLMSALHGQIGANTTALRGVTRQARRAMRAFG